MRLSEIKNLIWKQGRPLVYVQQEDSILEFLGRIVIKMFEGTYIFIWEKIYLKYLGFELKEVNVNGENFLLLNERSSKHNGSGSFFIRKAGLSQRVLQVFHVFEENKIGDIGLSLFLQEKSFKGLFVNTVHHHTQSDGTRKSLEPEHINRADAFRWKKHPLAFVAQKCFEFLNLSVVQIHGFDKISGYPDMVISSGSSPVNSITMKILSSLKENFKEYSIKVFPEEINLFGELSNLQSLNFEGYITHVSLADSFREELIASPDLMRNLAFSLSRK